MAEFKRSERAETLDQVEAALVECHALWWRSPGAGRWPFAGDGPWHLAQAEVGDISGDYSETLVRTRSGKDLQVRKVDTRAPRSPLDAGEVARRDAVTAWLELLDDPEHGPLDRSLVHRATWRLHRGDAGPGGRVPWAVLRREMRWAKSSDALAWRYRRAIAAICGRLNGWTERRVRAEAAAWVRADRQSEDDLASAGAASA